MVTTRGITDTMIVKLFSTKKSRMLLLAVCDTIACVIASFVALWVRFDFSISGIPDKYGINALKYAPIYIVGVLIVFNIFHLYSYMWSKASIREMMMIVVSCFVATLLQIAGMIILEWHQPRSYYILCFIVLTILVGLFRYSWRLRKSYVSTFTNKQSGDTARIMIYGAGDAGVAVLRELRNSEYIEGTCVCFIDDDKERDFSVLTCDERVKHIVEQASYYGFSGKRVKGLIFCSSIKESEALSRKLNQTINPDTGKKYRTI